jgi:hypothetical protein
LGTEGEQPAAGDLPLSPPCVDQHIPGTPGGIYGSGEKIHLFQETRSLLHIDIFQGHLGQDGLGARNIGIKIHQPPRRQGGEFSP